MRELLTPQAERRPSLLFPGVIAAVIVAILGAQLVAGEYTQFFVDFKVPYCAGQTMLQGGDPYRFGSLAVCEHTVAVPPYVPALRPSDPTLEPPPIPPYEMPPFLALARLPFAFALGIWMALNIGCCAIAAELLRRALPTLSPASIGTLVVLSALPVGLDLAQFTGIVLLAVTGLGLALRERKPVALALWLAVTAMQPHVALPAAIALLAGGGRAARIAVLACGAALACVSLVPFAQLSLEWATVVLPGAAAVNLIDSGQVSFVSAAASLGVPLDPLLLAAKAIYLAAIAFGALAGIRIAARSGRLEALPWIGTAIGTLGAPYLHLQQVTLVLPAAFLLIEIGPSRRWALVAAYLVAVPWAALVMQSWGPFFGLATAAAAWGRPSPRRVVAMAGVGVAVLLVLTVAAVCFTLLRQHAPLIAPRVAPGEDAWAAFIVAQAHAFGHATLAARALTWAGAIGLIACAAGAAFGARVTATRAPLAVAR